MPLLKIERPMAPPGGAELAPAGPPAAAATGTMTAAVPGGATPQRLYWTIGYGAIALGLVVGMILYDRLSPPAFTPISGVDAFALFYIVAQGLERLFEPFSTWVRGSVADGPTTTKPVAEAVRDVALAEAYAAPTDADALAALDTAAGAHATVEQVRVNTRVVAWGIQAGLAMIMGGAMGLFLLQGVGAKGVPVWLDLFITGLAVGGGSKALHDLISSVQTAKESKDAPAAAG